MEGQPDLGPARARGPERLGAQTPDRGVNNLPHRLDVTQANVLSDSLISWLAVPAVVLDRGNVDRMAARCAQVPLEAERAAFSAGVSVRIVDASVVFRAALSDLGLQPEFGKWVVWEAERSLTADDT